MGGGEGDLVPNLGRRSKLPPQEGGARRGGEEPLRLGGAGAGPAADQRGDAPRESPPPGHLCPEIGGGRAAES